MESPVPSLEGAGLFVFADGKRTRQCLFFRFLVRWLVLASNPRFTGSGAFGPPTEWQIGQLFQTRIVVDGVMKARENRSASIGHAVSEKLPGVVLDVVRDIGDWFGSFVNSLR